VGDDGDHSTTSSFQTKLNNFIQSNFLVCGMAVAVSLAKLAPSLGSPKTLPEILISKLGVFVVFLISGWSLELTELKEAILQVKLNTLIQSLNLVVWPFLIGLPVTAALRAFAPWALPV
jgi:predicted Na+-dependent transporter